MNAAVIHSHSQPPQFSSFPEPELSTGEVLVHMRAAGLHPIVKALAKGAHYSASATLPAIAGLDGVGTLADGTRVYCGGMRKPWGSMAELAAAPSSFLIPLPTSISDIDAAAIVNPGMSAWLSVKSRAALQPGETILILGATGVAGQLAIQSARILGAKRIIGVGRNLASLAEANLDAVIGLNAPDEEILDAFSKEAANGIDVVIDYLWGHPTELLLKALAANFSPTAVRSTRLVEVGESAGSSITLPGEYLRSMDLKLLGSGFGAVSIAEILTAVPQLFKFHAEGKLNVAVTPIPLTEVESAWNQNDKGKRIVFTL